MSVMTQGVPFSKVLRSIRDRQGTCLDAFPLDELVLYTKIRCAKGHVWKANAKKILVGGWCPKCQSSLEKNTIELMRAIAERRGGECISSEFKNMSSRLQWRCHKGHEWGARAASVKYHKSWCPECVGLKRGDIPKMKALAAKRGGWCLSKRYINNKTKLRWKCAKGHVWAVKPNSISNGFWCPMCAGKGLGSIQEMRQIARSRGGRCLSPAFQAMRKKLLWECSRRHRWEATSEHIKNRKQWCPYCGGSRLSLDILREVARKRGGKCLSKVYVPAPKKMEWECAKGHRWFFDAPRINRGSWCPMCSPSRKLTIEEMHELARKRGGECLSNKYLNKKTRLKWKCGSGHIWISPAASVRRGTWCPKCALAATGKKKRLTIEEMRARAKKNGGRCISANYQTNKVPLIWECKLGHRWSAAPAGVIQGSWCPICGRAEQASKIRLTIEEMRLIAKRKGGKCLSTQYIDLKTQLEWSCAHGHRWWATPWRVKSGRTWCPTCAR